MNSARLVCTIYSDPQRCLHGVALGQGNYCPMCPQANDAPVVVVFIDPSAPSELQRTQQEIADAVMKLTLGPTTPKLRRYVDDQELRE